MPAMRAWRRSWLWASANHSGEGCSPHRRPPTRAPLRRTCPGGGWGRRRGGRAAGTRGGHIRGPPAPRVIAIRSSRELRKLGRNGCTAAAPAAHPTPRGWRRSPAVNSRWPSWLWIATLTPKPAELFLSVKTVETHMRNIFRKLDANSRVEVARIVERNSSVRAGDTPT